MNPLALFQRNRTSHVNGGPPVRTARPALGPAPWVALPHAIAAPAPMANADPPLAAKALGAMLAVLDHYVPPSAGGLPASSLALVSVTARTVGLGDRVGNDTRPGFGVAALKGIRVDAVVRYQLWAAMPADVDTASRLLVTTLLGDRAALQAQGILRLSLVSAGSSEDVPTLPAWRQNAEFRVLYEFPYVDSDGAPSVIARIPITLDSEYDEATVVTDEMARWDDEAAPTLTLRGRSSIGRVSALVFIPGTTPSGMVTVTRTFDGAPGPTPIHPDLPTFLAAITDPDRPAREGQVAFASLDAFLAAFAGAGGDVTLKGPDENDPVTIYRSLSLTIEPALTLSSPADRLEIAHGQPIAGQPPPLDQAAVVYLRATRR
jgi:hypothetical protein